MCAHANVCTHASVSIVGSNVILYKYLYSSSTRSLSLALQTCRNDVGINVLVCSRGGGGLLVERMELVAELWEENIKVSDIIPTEIFEMSKKESELTRWHSFDQAELVPLCDPSLTEQYEYASEHDIKCLVIVTDTGVTQKGSVKVGPVIGLGHYVLNACFSELIIGQTIFIHKFHRTQKFLFERNPYNLIGPMSRSVILSSRKKKKLRGKPLSNFYWMQWKLNLEIYPSGTSSLRLEPSLVQVLLLDQFFQTSVCMGNVIKLYSKLFKHNFYRLIYPHIFHKPHNL